MRWWIAVVLAACQSTRGAAPIATHRPAELLAKEKPGGRTVVSETVIEILDPIRFLSGSAALHPSSQRILDAIAQTLQGNPSIRLVAVHAYGDDALAQFQARVGVERAQAIVDQLVARGVQRMRLIADGRAAPPAGSAAEPSFEIVLRRDP